MPLFAPIPIVNTVAQNIPGASTIVQTPEVTQTLRTVPPLGNLVNQVLGIRAWTPPTSETYCLQCGNPAWVVESVGRWDAATGKAKEPFDPVFVAMSCGHTVGDASLGQPVALPDKLPTE